jgi:hypothetical protein
MVEKRGELGMQGPDYRTAAEYWRDKAAAERWEQTHGQQQQTPPGQEEEEAEEWNT